MKILTKEWARDFEFQVLIELLNSVINKKMPFVLLNGESELIAKKDLYSVKSNFDLSDKENKMDFILIPNTFNLQVDDCVKNKLFNEKMYLDSFVGTYLNCLRVISFIPDDILKSVKDKRLLALGYAEQNAKNKILGYIKNKYKRAFDLLQKSRKASVKAGKELSLSKQLESRRCLNTVGSLFYKTEITKIKRIKDDIYLTLYGAETVVFFGAEIVEEEADILNCTVRETELYKKDGHYELHFLLMRKAEYYNIDYFYVTYKFKDLKLAD